MIRPLLIGILIAATMLMVHTIHAQSNDWRTHLEQLAEEEEMEEMSIDNIFVELSMMEQNPMNLNSVTRTELELLPLLSLNQANAIADFLEKNRPIYTIFELRNVYMLDHNTVDRKSVV